MVLNPSWPVFRWSPFSWLTLMLAFILSLLPLICIRCD
jgi:hypothetical protein